MKENEKRMKKKTDYNPVAIRLQFGCNSAVILLIIPVTILPARNPNNSVPLSRSLRLICSCRRLLLFWDNCL